MAKIAYLIRRLIHFVRPVHYVGPALPRRVSLESGGTAEVFSGNANWVSLESGGTAEVFSGDAITAVTDRRNL